MDKSPAPPEEHRFVRAPHRTLVGLSIPVMLSFIAEPLTGLVDSYFVSGLEAGSLAALGVGTTLLSATFWLFNFLGVTTQTEVAHALGEGDRATARELNGLALSMAALIGLAIAAAGWLGASAAASAMDARGGVHDAAVLYLHVRVFSAPAVLMTVAAMGSLRGLQDMRTPLFVALAINALNVGLDAVLIRGVGPIPPLGIAGVAWATVASQWVGACLALWAVRARLGLTRRIRWRDARRLVVIGGDMFLRTGLLATFLILNTRAALRISTNAADANQIIRKVWEFTAFLLDAFAVAAQSLIGYFLAAGRTDVARRVVGVAMLWGGGCGLALAGLMLAGESQVADLLVPEAARPAFAMGWWIAALFQPLNAISFTTDGIHWGARDYRFLRNVMLLATGAGAAALLLLDKGAPGAGQVAMGADESAPGAMTALWLITGGWIAIRALFGVLRIWPGIGRAPLRPPAEQEGVALSSESGRDGSPPRATPPPAAPN